MLLTLSFQTSKKSLENTSGYRHFRRYNNMMQAKIR
jgi:hypothetical protein